MENNVAAPKRRRQYAETTQASSDRTRSDIQKLMVKAGASHFGYSSEPGFDTVAFVLNGRRVKLVLPLPAKDDDRVLYTNSYKWMRSPGEQAKAYDQLVRSRWRALYLIIKAKIEAVDLGITTAEDEFLANTILPNQQTVSEYIQPQIERVYLTGKMPEGLAALEGGKESDSISADYVQVDN